MPRAPAPTTTRWWGDDVGGGHANCNGCGSQWDDKLLAPVDAFAPNAFGLSGMLGNAWEWTADCWHPSYVGAPADGRAWTDSFCIRHASAAGPGTTCRSSCAAPRGWARPKTAPTRIMIIRP